MTANVETPRRVSCRPIGTDLTAAIHDALKEAGILDRISSGATVALKPNLTYPYYKPGVTTSPNVVRETIRVLREYTRAIAIVETDGGYGVWTAREAFKGHGFEAMAREFEVELVNLCDEPREMCPFVSRGRCRELPLPVRLTRQTDVLISMPVPKIHAMTGVTLAYKNQWGCVPDIMRLRRHYLFDDAIVAINQALKPAVLGDGTFFLDRNGPMDGEAVPMNLVIAASDAGTFDRYVSEVMGVPWKKVSHFRKAVAKGDMPASLDEITVNAPPSQFARGAFNMEPTLRTWIAFAGFKSRAITWLGYESWFGRVVLHWILYAFAGPPVQPAPPDAGSALATESRDGDV